MSKLLTRMVRAARLERGLYEEVEADREATVEAAVVVVISSIAAGIGTLPVAGAQGIVLTTVGCLIFWCMWALLTYLIGTKLLPEPQTRADVGELLRTIGFATAPGVLTASAIVPLLGPLVWPTVWVWLLAAMVVAVRQALDYESTARAVAVCVLGFAICMLIPALLLRPSVSQ